MIYADNLDLFKNRSIIELIDYMWRICRIYFIYNRFVPFTLLLYVPVTLFTLLPISTEDDGIATVQLICLCMASLYIFY